MKFFYIIGVYTVCVYIHEDLADDLDKLCRILERRIKKVKVEGFDRDGSSVSKEKVSNKLDRIGF